jgi:dTDP-4-amino-4,6-dideoxygalactose transaminase
MGLTNLEAMDSFVEINRSNYAAYSSGLAGLSGLRLLRFDESETNNFQYIVVEVDPSFPVSRDEIVRILHAENVLARKYFWPGCHNMEPYRSYYPHAGLVLANTRLVADRVIVLPTGSAMRDDDIARICAVMRVLATATHG